MKKILKLLGKKDWSFVAFSMVLIVGQVWLDLTMPDYMNKISKILLTTGNVKEITINGIYMLLLALGSLALSIAVGYLTAKVAASLGQKLRNAVYAKVSSFSKAEISRFSTSSLITRSTNDTQQITFLVGMGLQVLVKAPIMAVWGIIKILGKSWQWSVLTACAVVFLLLVITTIMILCVPKFKVVQKQTDDINRVTRENLTGIRIIHAFNAEEYAENKFEKVNNNLTRTQTFTSKTMAFMNPTMNFVIGMTSMLIYWIGALVISRAGLIEAKLVLYTDMAVFLEYAMRIISSFVMLVMIFMMMPRAMVSLKRIGEVLNTTSTVCDGQGAIGLEEGIVEFKNVSFKYPDGKENVLSDINIKINKGETVAFIGATGCGKSTLIDLVPRFYDATEGEVLVDGVNVKDYTLEQIHSKVGYVSQKAILLSGTVFDNVTMGHDIEPNDVVKAIKYSEAKEFVEKMEGKENAEIYQGGKNISGGQKQRLSIARAIAKKPEIMIFDDSFSALDYKTDKKLRKTLNKEFKGITCLIVAQRIGTIREADKIVVLDKGKIVGMGKHDELMQGCKVYQEIALSQLSEEELR